MLGQILVAEGKLTEEQFTRVLEVMKETKKRQGEILVELGYMTACQVYEALKEQAGKKFQNCLLMEEAEVQLEKGEEHLEGVPDLTIDMFRISLDLSALHDIDDEAKLPMDQAPKLTEQGKTYLKDKAVRPNESRVVRTFDGTKTLETLISGSGLDPSAVEVMAYALQALGFLEFNEPLPQRFSRPASEVSSNSMEEDVVNEPERQVVTIDEKEPPCSKDLPIYTWALRLDKPLTDLLNVGVTTTKIQIRKAYEGLVRDLHLDSIVENYEEKDRKIAEDVFNRLTLAVTILSDDKRRHEYVTDLAQRKPAKDPSKGITAEVHLQKAKVLMNKKQFSGAEKEIRSAIELMPEESAYYVALADLQLHQAIADKVTPLPESIEQTLKKALSLNQQDLMALFQYGIYAKLNSDFEKAKNLFQKILEVAPNHKQTLSEIRLVNQRLEAKKKPSILGLFKKK